MTRPFAAALLASAALCAALPAAADTSGKKIALSNNYAGNSWRQAMLKSWEKVTTPRSATAPLPLPTRSPPPRTRSPSRPRRSRT